MSAVNGALPSCRTSPAIAERYPGYLNVAWYAFVAPPKTPDAIVRKLADAIAETLERPDVARRMRELGLTTLKLSPAATAAFIKDEAARWGKAIRDAGIKAD